MDTKNLYLFMDTGTGMEFLSNNFYFQVKGREQSTAEIQGRLEVGIELIMVDMPILESWRAGQPEEDGQKARKF